MTDRWYGSSVHIQQPVTRDRNLYAQADADKCMITVTEDVDEGTIWLSIAELDRLMEGLQKIRQEIDLWKTYQVNYADS